MPRRTSKVSEKKRLANQRNAQKSTGPKTLEGKKRSSQNAITHGLFCQEVCVLKEDRALFKELRREFIRDLKPQNLLELSFVDSVIETQWKLRRLRIAESTAHEQELRKYCKAFNIDFDEEMKTTSEPEYCAATAAVGMMRRDPDDLEKYGRSQQRSHNMIYRALKELRICRENQKLIDALPKSPFEATLEDVQYGFADKRIEEEARAAAAAEVKAPVREEEVEKEELEDEGESAEQSQLPSDASPSPLPSPTRGEGVEKTQNEANVVRTAVARRVYKPVGPFQRPPTWRYY
jgi:hypothetical protein